jgi:hypothetical protein
MRLTCKPQTTLLIGLTHRSAPVWKCEAGLPFTVSAGGLLRRLWWPLSLPRSWGYKKLDAPHLNYLQVLVAAKKSRALAEAAIDGVVKFKNGGFYSKTNRPIVSKSEAAAVIQWLEILGITLCRASEEGGRTFVKLVPGSADVWRKVTSSSLLAIDTFWPDAIEDLVTEQNAAYEHSSD